MQKAKKPMQTEYLINTAYQVIFDILEDETGHPSYRKYLDKAINDIFGLDSVGTRVLMAHNQFKVIKRIIKDPDAKAFCQMLKHKEDIKALDELVHVMYDAVQIANKPKKRLTSKDIKAYRYLTDLYTKGVKKLRKKYKAKYEDNKKSYKTKYSNLNRFVGNRYYGTPHYQFDDFEDNLDESLESLFDDEDDDNDDINLHQIKYFEIHSDTSPLRKTQYVYDGNRGDYVFAENCADEEIESPEAAIKEEFVNSLNENNKVKSLIEQFNSIEYKDEPIEQSLVDSNNIEEPVQLDTKTVESNDVTKEYDNMTTEELITEFNDTNSKNADTQ